MKKPKDKSVRCKRCGFVFTVENKPVFAWMDEFDGCIIGNPDYCDAQPLRQSGNAAAAQDRAPAKGQRRKKPTVQK